MTTAELIAQLEGFPDDTRIYVPSIEVAGDSIPAKYLEVFNDGSDGDIAEVMIVGDGE